MVGGNARLVLSARLPEERLAAFRAHAGAGQPTAGGDRRYSLTEADHELALDAVVTAITFLPVVKFDADLVRKRFGEPAERLPVQDGMHWLYPSLGLDLLLGDNGGALLQYVPPAHVRATVADSIAGPRERGTTMTGLPDHYAVMGNPIAHSKSPRIHALFAAPDRPESRIPRHSGGGGRLRGGGAAFRDAGGKGLNVTVPFKQDAWVFADLLSARAERAGAVNTLVFDATGVRGDNTDGPGLVRDLTGNHGCPLADKKILLLGRAARRVGVAAADWPNGRHNW